MEGKKAFFFFFNSMIPPRDLLWDLFECLTLKRNEAISHAENLQMEAGEKCLKYNELDSETRLISSSRLHDNDMEEREQVERLSFFSSPAPSDTQSISTQKYEVRKLINTHICGLRGGC